MGVTNVDTKGSPRGLQRQFFRRLSWSANTRKISWSPCQISLCFCRCMTFMKFPLGITGIFLFEEKLIGKFFIRGARMICVNLFLLDSATSISVHRSRLCFLKSSFLCFRLIRNLQASLYSSALTVLSTISLTPDT